MLRKLLAVLLAVVVAGVGIVAASCGGNEEEAPTVKIGGVYPLSGPLAGAGETMMEGLLLAVKDMNDQGGVLGAPVETVIRDTKAMVDEAVVPGIVDEFITKENVRGRSAMAATRRSRKKSKTETATKHTTTTNIRRNDSARKLARVVEKLAPSKT